MKMNKLNKTTMNNFKILSVALFASASVVNAQDINEVKKQIDAEQYQKAKTSLKSIIKSNPSEGTYRYLFLLFPCFSDALLRKHKLYR